MSGLLADFDGDVRRLVALLIFFAIVTAISFRAASFKRRVIHPMADRWDQIQGKIEHTDVFVENRGKIDVHVAQITYSYRVNGEFFSGEFTKDYLREKNAYALIDSVSPGTEVVVRCHPVDPRLSVLREDDNTALLSRKLVRTS